MSTQSKVNQYIESWKQCGYSDDIPDSVPDALMKLGLAPSYKAIAVAILKNDVALQGLGFSVPNSPWYTELKRIEIEARQNGKGFSMKLFEGAA